MSNYSELHAIFFAEAVKAAASIKQNFTQYQEHPSKFMLEAVRSFTPSGDYDELDLIGAKSDVIHFILGNVHPDKPDFQTTVGFGYKGN